MTDQSDDFFSELEAEISLATSAAKIKTEIENNRKKSFNMRLAPDQRQEAKRLFQEAEAILDAARWESHSTVALFSEQKCDGCGSVHRIFLQYMEKQVFTTKTTTSRMVRTTRPKAGLPRSTMVRSEITHICADCCIDHGFEFEGHSLKCSPIAPSPTYTQEDIHAPSEEA